MSFPRLPHVTLPVHQQHVVSFGERAGTPIPAAGDLRGREAVVRHQKGADTFPICIITATTPRELDQPAVAENEEGRNLRPVARNGSVHRRQGSLHDPYRQVRTVVGEFDPQKLLVVHSFPAQKLEVLTRLPPISQTSTEGQLSGAAPQLGTMRR